LHYKNIAKEKAMKKINFIRLLIIILTLTICVSVFASCNGKTNTPEDNTPEGTTPEDTTPEDTTPDITAQEVYDLGKNLSALLGDHENVYVQVTINDKVIKEEYMSKKYCYSFYDEEYMNIGFESSNFATDTDEYFYMDNVYALNVTLAPNGIVEMTGLLDMIGSSSFISSQVLNDEVSIVEENGLIIVSCVANVEELELMGEDIVSCVETYTVDATTREITSIKTVYTYADGTIEEGIVTITRDVEYPEGVKPFVAYAEETENMRTFTIVSNPGTANEKTESIRVPRGLQVAVSVDFEIEDTFTIYADAACTQVLTASGMLTTTLQST
jgi:hypothetical protein